MAIKASAQITISKVIDIYACYRYYKLQSSTLAKPSKPTTNPPSGWSDTEPAYVSGSTNTLYFVDCNVYSDKSFSFSEVSKSSSYEAAKDAWNKANNAQNTANSAQNKVDNLQIGGRNLIIDTASMKTWINGSKLAITYGQTDVKSGKNAVKIINSEGTYGNAWFEKKLTANTILKSGIYTLSLYAKSEEVSGSSIQVIAVWNGYGKTTSKTFKIDNTWKRYTFSVNVTTDITSTEVFWINFLGTNPIYLCYLKYEAGNVATDWTPAPEDNIAKVDVEYYLSTSATSLSGGSWSTTAPTWVNGKYMWSRTVTVDGAGNKTYSPNQNGVCIAGAKGDKGATGETGPQGPQGGTGPTGKGVSSIVEQYYKSTSATTLSGGSWSNTYPGWENGKYIWTRSIITYTDKNSTTTTPVCVTGTKGDTGAKGDAGSAGASLVTLITSYSYNQTEIDTYAKDGYSGSWDVTSASGVKVNDTVLLRVRNTTKNGYCYIIAKVTKVESSTRITATSQGVVDKGNTGAKGDKGETGPAGKGISSTEVTYQASTSGTTIPKGTWATSIPTVAAGSYLWTRTIITYTDKTSTTSYAVGKMGNTGATGKGIKSTSITYQAHSNGTTAPTGTWTDLVPTTSAEKPYLWSRTILTYTDNTTSTTYSVGSTPDGVLAEIKKVLRYDDTKITLGRTGSDITLNLQNDKMSITNGEDIRASFESDKLTLGNGYLVLGYDDTASGIGAYLTSSEYDAINLVVPAVLGSIPNGDNISSRLHMWGGPRPAIELSNSEGADLLVGVVQDEATSEYGSLIRLNAEYIKLQATKKLTYNIPVLESQDCNALTESGKYYIGNKATNRPENTNGWLECMKYSTNYCAQTYTTYNGKKYTRYQQNGRWGAWFRVWQSRQLFGNESQAMNVAITLSDSAANYDMLEIFYKTNDSVQNNARVYSPNNKRVSLTSTYYVRSGKDMILKSKTVLISGNKIDTLNLSGHGYATAESILHNGATVQTKDADNVGIIRVLGWR